MTRTPDDGFDTDVLVVGAGPAGATAALALATYGVDAISLNKHRSPSPHARAHITNQRTMEIFRDFGLERRVLGGATPHELMRDTVYATTLAGRELGRFESWSTSARTKMQHDLISPSTMVDLPQKLLEPILVSEAAARGAEMRTSTELLDLSQDADGVTAQLRDRLNGHEYSVRSRYLIGADGSNSRVVDLLGIPLEGKRRLGATIGVEFRADLTRFVQHRPGVLYWLVQPGYGLLGYSIGGLRMVRPWDEWVINFGYPVDGPEPVLTEEGATAMVHRLIGDDTVPVEIQKYDTWTMNMLHATGARRGRAFVMGDAIHRHPPMNGLGSNTSIQDAYNLAWKLALVLRGQAGDSLLDSYEAERQPIAERLVVKVMTNMHVYKPVAEAIGLTQHVQTQAELDDRIAEFEAPDAEGARRRTAFRAALDANLYGFSAIGGEVNHLYDSGAVIPDGRDLSVDDPEMEVIFGMQSGRRLPHVWLTHDQHRVSTLDLCGAGTFALLTARSGGAAWRAAASGAASRLGVTLPVRVIGPHEDHQDTYGDFAKLCLPDETGAVLVRPDQVVGWHVESLPADPGAALTAALAALLGRTADLAKGATATGTPGSEVPHQVPDPADRAVRVPAGLPA